MSSPRSPPPPPRPRYDLRRDDQLVYVVTTESKFREDRDDVIADITRAIARQLTQAGLVR